SRSSPACSTGTSARTARSTRGPSPWPSSTSDALHAPDALPPDALGLLALTLAPGMGPVRIARVLDAFGTFERVRAASAAELARVPGIGDKTARSILESLKDADARVTRELERIARARATVLTLADDAYPPL